MDDFPTIESDSDSNSGHEPTSNDKIKCDQDERNEAVTTSMIQIAEPISRRVTRSSSLQSLLDIHKPLSRSLQSLNTSGDLNTGISKGRRVKKELTDEQKKKDRERKQRERATKKSNVALPPPLLNTPSASTTRKSFNSTSDLLSRSNPCYSSIESLDSTAESDAGISQGRRVKKELTDEQKKKDRERKQRERATKKSNVALPPPLLNTPSPHHSSIELISDACAEASIRRSLLNPMPSPLHRTNPCYSSLESLDSTTSSINKCKKVKKELTEEQKKKDRERKQRKRSTKKLEGPMSTPSTSKSMNKSINQFVPTPSTQLSFGMTELDIQSADSADSADNVPSELRAPKRLYMFAKPTFTPKKPRRKPARNEGENLMGWMKRTGQQSFHNQYFSKEVEASDVDLPMLMSVKTEDDVEDDEIRSNDQMEIDDDHDSVQIISHDELMKIAPWRMERKKKHDEIRMKLPSLTKQLSRIMSAQEKDFTITKNLVPAECSLGDRQTCNHCGALTYTFNCCSHGKVRLPSPLLPPRYILKKLTGDSEADEHFRKEIVKYNNAFAMGSMSYDREKTSGTHPYVKVNGSVHHMLSGTSLPSDKTVPLFHQLYKYDVNEAMKYRMMNPVTGNSIMPNIVRNIQVILERENFLVKQYKMSIDITTEMMKCRKPVKNVCVVLRAPHELNVSSVHHPGTLSRPRKEVQSLLYTTEPDGGPGKQNMFIRHRQYGGKLETVGYWNPLVDPLGYPLLFPYGNAGFKRGEFKLNEDYVSKEIRDEFYSESDVFDDYPFNHLNDEMEKGVEAIDYEAARQKYKEYRREQEEDVSSSSCSEDEDDKDVDIANEEISEEDGLFEQIGSDDDDENEGNSGHFFFEDSSADEEIDQPEIVRLSTPEPDDVDVELLMRKRVDEWKRREEQVQREIFKKERKLLMKNDKLRSFKELCLHKRADGSFFYKMFKDNAEIKKVFIDLEFLERKRMKEIDDLYKIAVVVLNKNLRHIDLEYADNLGRLQEEVDIEIGKLCASKQYRSDDPDIYDFRLNYLDPHQFDDNAGSDIDDPDDVVQHDVTEEMPKSKREVQPVRCGKGKRENVSRCQHALHQMQIRDPKFHPYLSTLMLGQLYVIDVALRIIRQKNDNTRGHMIKLRGSQEDTLTYKKHSASATRKGFNLGYAFEISNDKVGSTAWYRDQFERAMAQMDYTGKPDLFITMTGNPAWEEIDKNKLPHSEWQSNPFLVNDVFHSKKKDLLIDVIEDQLFGPVVSYCYSIEFQKRGMPHMHLLVTLQEGHKLDTSAKIDKYIQATIPDEPLSDDSDDEKERKIRFRNNVVKHMLHTACIGSADGAYCQSRSASNSNRVHTRCTKNFPVPFNTHTSTVDGGKVDYHRPDDGVTIVKTVGRNKTITVDNRWVVPYNPFLLNKYNCHINVEVTTSVDVVKYIYKYIYKGFDKALAQFIEMSEIDDGGAGQPPRTVVHAKKDAKTAVLMPRGLKGTQRQLTDMNERINQELRRYNIEPKNGEKLTAYDEAIMVEVFRQMTASEAAWIIQGYFLSGLSHTVIDLSVHEEGKMPFFFRKGEEELMQKKIEDKQYKSKFVAWFDLNKRDPNARQYTYDEIPLHYRFVITPTSREWVPYKLNMTRNIARVRPVSPRFLEAFAIRLLAMNVKGPQSFADLRTVNGITFTTAHEAAKAAGLMDSQMEYERCLDEAIKQKFPNRLRALFATMLVFGGVQDPRALWIEFEASFYDRRLEHQPDRARNAALFHIQYLLSDQGFTLSDFNLPECDGTIFLSQKDKDLAIDGCIMDDPRDYSAEAEKMVASLNIDQKKAYDIIMSAVENNGMGIEGNCFFLQGSGGCGKTYVYRAIYFHLQSLPTPISVSMIATTGIAATLLIKGTTAHRKFKLPLNCDEASNSSISFESKAAEALRQTTVLIIDESTMASRFVFKAIHNLLKEIMQVDKPFGGKIILLGGDWKQLLPVVAGASSKDAVFHTLKNDDLWKHFTVLTLSKNMRAQKDPQYATLLENVGNGLVNGIPDNCVRLPSECIASSMDDVIDFIYHDMSLDPLIIAQSCILASLNAETCEINGKVLDMLPGDSRTYTAIDTPKDGIGMQVPPEYFRDEIPSGLPPYELTLKKNAIVILLRNINVSRGLCNGSRLRVVNMFEHFVECELLTTDFAGTVVWITKASVDPPSKGKKNANYSRFQLPLRLAYAMTINKSQGQTFDRVGIILKNNVFSHGQLYVALSRARECAKVRLYSASQMNVDGRMVVAVRNMVEYAVLEPIPPGSLIDPDYVEPEYVDVVEELISNPRRRSKYKHDHSKSVVYQNTIKEHNKVKASKKKTV